MFKFNYVKKIFYLFICLTVCISICLNGQVINNYESDKIEKIKQKSAFNLDEIKVRWKKAALENCLGIPCIISPPVPGNTCGSISTVSDFDGNSYNTVSIGNQCWIKENLKVTTYNDGTIIPFDASGGSLGNGSGETWSGQTTGAYTVYGNESITGPNATNYGFLYNWYAAAGIITTGGLPSKNICPIGWHVPTENEAHILIDFLGGLSVTGGKLKEVGTTYWFDPFNGNVGATNESGFSARGGGTRNSGGSYSVLKQIGFFWTSSPNFEFDCANNNIGAGLSNVSFKTIGYSIRCLKN
jgi:uncharacterized protein (TIGR02145 family)